MKQYIKMAFIIAGLLAVVSIIDVYAKVRSIESPRDFEQRIDQKGICVALFYHNADKSDSRLRAKNKQLKRMFEDLSEKQSYDNADVVFMRVNIGRKEFDGFIDQYNVAEVPSFILFSKGRSIKNRQGEPLVLTGFVAREKLEAFIDAHCGAEVRELNVAQAEVKKQRIVEEKDSWQAYFYPRDIFVKDYDPDQRNME